MALEFEHKPGQTPLDPDEVAGLRPKHIATQGDLDEWETDRLSCLETSDHSDARHKGHESTSCMCNQHLNHTINILTGHN